MRNVQCFTRLSGLAATPEEVHRWYARPGALERLTPPWERIEILDRTGGIEEEGSRVTVRLRIGPLRVRCVAQHVDCIPGRGFTDVQLRGPFAAWSHFHGFEPTRDGCMLADSIKYRLAGGVLGRLLASRGVRRRLERTFDYRHATTAADLEAHRRAGLDAIRIAVTGSHGLVGSALVPFLTTGGHAVQRIGRRNGWELDLAPLECADAVVHLAGENIASGRWSASKKERILRSRTESTTALVRHLAGMQNPPRVLVCASAIGIYGDRGDEPLDESSTPGRGFLSDVCRAWEQAAAAAAAKGTRVVCLRFGMILSPSGGALARMLPPFRLGLGGRIGNGRQYLSWIGIDDAIGAILHAIARESLSGPVNAVAPEPSTNRDFARLLAQVLHRPALLPLPAFAARLAFGELADALLLSSTRVVASRLLESGYRFRDNDLEKALHRILGR